MVTTGGPDWRILQMFKDPIQPETQLKFMNSGNIIMMQGQQLLNKIIIAIFYKRCTMHSHKSHVEK